MAKECMRNTGPSGWADKKKDKKTQSVPLECRRSVKAVKEKNNVDGGRKKVHRPKEAQNGRIRCLGSEIKFNKIAPQAEAKNKGPFYQLTGSSGTVMHSVGVGAEAAETKKQFAFRRLDLDGAMVVVWKLDVKVPGFDLWSNFAD